MRNINLQEKYSASVETPGAFVEVSLMLSVSRMWPHAGGTAGIARSSLQVTALALLTSPLLLLHISKAPKPQPHLRDSFSFFFFPVFVVL